MSKPAHSMLEKNIVNKIVIGLPSKNEASRIQQITRRVDEVANRANIDALLINADSDSDDRTPDLFSETATKCEKVSMQVPPGKGSGLLEIMKYGLGQGGDAFIFVDTDLPAFPEEWLRSFVACCKNGYDAVFPRRTPHWNAGDLTYHFCYPVLTGVSGARLHEPIAGEYLISRRAAEKALELQWPASSLGYGCDVFFAAAMVSGAWCEVFLEHSKNNVFRSFRQHSSGRTVMGTKLYEILESLLLVASRSIKTREIPHAIQDSSIGECKWTIEPITESAEMEQIRRATGEFLESNLSWENADSRLKQIFKSAKFSSNYYGITWDEWKECLWWMLESPIELFREQLVLIEQLLLARTVGFYYEHLGSDSWLSGIDLQANDFAERCRLGQITP